jgi:N-acetyl-gamma-glutamyl-phosphate reductase
MNGTTRIRVAVLGATGYVGGELLRLLAGHGGAQVTLATSVRHAGRRAAEVFPALGPAGDLPLTALAVDADDRQGLADSARRVREAADVVLSALPHARSAAVLGAMAAAGLRVIDLSADFRLPDPELYARVYGAAHPHPELAARAVYGLVELQRERIAKADLVAVPGCYPTATLLALAPLLTGGFADVGAGVVADCKSGVSGSGREVKTDSLFCEVAGGVRPYAVGVHRHQAEMACHAESLGGRAVEVFFTPQVVPMARGILACVYARLAEGRNADPEALRAHYADVYAGSPFVEVLPAGTWPQTRWVTGTNRAALGVTVTPSGQVAALCAIDNLVKGAAGQAVQCFNLMLGLPEATGLPLVGGPA